MGKPKDDSPFDVADAHIHNRPSEREEAEEVNIAASGVMVFEGRERYEI